MNPEAELFIEVANCWNLEKLYADLARAKQVNLAKAVKLTATEQTIIRGLLADRPPKQIATALHWTSSALSVELSRGLYRYIEIAVDRPINSLKNWREIANWLEAAGYKQGKISLIEANKDIVINLENVPEIDSFYGREKEIEKLASWTIDEKYRLIVIYGLAGIGKTALAVRLTHNIASKFAKVIWLNLSHAPLLTDVLTELLSYFENSQTSLESRSIHEKLSRSIGYLKQQSCLVILNSYEAILDRDNLTGFYREEYRNYSQLIKRIAEEHHSSCLLITSQDEPIDLSILRSKKVDSLHLNSLGESAKLLLQECNLFPENSYSELIDRYYGNPLALKLVANTVRELFAGDLDNFLDRQTEFGVIVPNFFRTLFSDLFKSLSILERSIVCCLAESKYPLTIDAIKANLTADIYTSDLLEAMTKLKRCSLVEKITQNNQTVFTLQPMIRKHLIREGKGILVKQL